MIRRKHFGRWVRGKRASTVDKARSSVLISDGRRATTRAAAFNGAYAARIGDPATQACKKGRRRHPWQCLGGGGDLSAEVKALMATADASGNGWTWWICVDITVSFLSSDKILRIYLNLWYSTWNIVFRAKLEPKRRWAAMGDGRGRTVLWEGERPRVVS